MTRTTRSRRYHGLDLLRATMMVLGVVIHVALCYMPVLEGTPQELRWAYTDPKATPIAGITVYCIHMFRMPIFFVLAGFFTDMMIRGRGTAAFAWNRTARILLPFLVGWFLLWPATMFTIGFATARMSQDGNGIGALELMGRIDLVRCLPFMLGEDFIPGRRFETNLLHLWFLYYLLIYCILAVPIARFVDGRGGRFRETAGALIGRVVEGDLRWMRFPVLIGLTFIMLLGSRDGTGIDTRVTFVPDPLLLVTYFLFFLVGWVVHRHAGVMDDLRKGAWRRTGLGLLLMGVGMAVSVVHLVNDPPGLPTTGSDEVILGMRFLSVTFVLAQFVIATAIWMLVFGFMGLSERVFNRHRPTVRYLVDASYFIYLAHLPLCILIPPLLRNWSAPGLVKMGASMVLASIPLLIGYHFLVRGTFVGRLLNGRNYPLVAPWKHPRTGPNR